MNARNLCIFSSDGVFGNHRHKYLTLVNDLSRNRVLYVAEDREQRSLDGFWPNIEAVAMDMWDPCVASVREHVAESENKIVFDKFHIAQHLGEAVDRVRRREHKQLKAEGDDRLTGTKYDWLRNPAALEGEPKREFAQLRQSELKTARAWALKETAMAFYNYVYQGPARKHFHWWYNWAVRSRLQPMKNVSQLWQSENENSIRSELLSLQCCLLLVLHRCAAHSGNLFPYRYQ